ncbi:homing endonuclease [Agrobacterium phage OLIVR5]|uniref:Homing endonuclease n=3 Tax=Caudoviricetes TaxID=2731619 RepID=A0A858MT07_9CAUD|nr:homing endonuclease [Agrobacterium phage OLIVR5]QIW87904.1 homing endonuclease [Agrobacterium phage OLIVR5]QIW88169.1 homing endonuclease [Agrobacterium phage OLIVR6]
MDSITDTQYSRFPRGYVYTDGRHYKIYRSIVDKAVSENRNKNGEIYFESHHIVPKSYDGDNSKENLVLLTAREHYICHLLLTRMFSNITMRKKMTRALAYFRSRGNSASRSFALARTIQSRGMRGNKIGIGYKQSQEHIDKRVASLKKTLASKK